MRKIRGVLFDADGVVQKAPDDWIQRVAALAPEKQLEERFLTEIFAAEKPCMLGEETFEDTLARVLREWGSGVPVDLALDLWTLIEADQDVLALVGGLRASGFKVALATNQQAHRAAFMSHSLGYAKLFDRLLYSCELGAAKPSQDFFSAAVRVLDMPVDQLLFIDDSDTNTSAAASFGMVAEPFHLSEGAERLASVLERHGVVAA